MRRMIRAARWALALALAAYAGRQLLAGARPAAPLPRYGVTPWGEPTGLRVSPLSSAETREAVAREWQAAGS